MYKTKSIIFNLIGNKNKNIQAKTNKSGIEVAGQWWRSKGRKWLSLFAHELYNSLPVYLTFIGCSMENEAYV